MTLAFSGLFIFTERPCLAAYSMAEMTQPAPGDDELAQLLNPYGAPKQAASASSNDEKADDDDEQEPLSTELVSSVEMEPPMANQIADEAGIAWEASENVTGIEAGDVLAPENTGEGPLWLTYFSILYGPSLRNTTSYQPTPAGLPDRDRPVLVRNHLSLGYDISERLLIAGTVPFTWIPVQGQRFELRDPYMRVGLDHILHSDILNYYVDMRVHFPVTKESRNQDMLASIQTFQILTLVPSARSSWSLDLFGSVRANFYGRQGSGADLELYFAPQLNYQASSTIAFTVLYEMGISHWFGDKPWLFYSDGTDLEPGISWDVTPTFNIHPYMNIFPSGKVSWDSTSVGVMLNWKLL